MLSNAISALGLALVALGLFVLAPWLGIAATGACLVLVGLALDRDKREGE